MFTEAYLMQCIRMKDVFRRKRTFSGDWYIDTETGLEVVSSRDVDRVRFDSPEVYYIPDTDDLLEFIDNQVEASGFLRLPKLRQIVHQPGTVTPISRCTPRQKDGSLLEPDYARVQLDRRDRLLPEC